MRNPLSGHGDKVFRAVCPSLKDVLRSMRPEQENSLRRAAGVEAAKRRKMRNWRRSRSTRFERRGLWLWS